MATAMAARLWKLLRDRRPARLSIEELMRELHAPSKASIERAIAELEDKGLLRSEVLDEV